MLPLGVAVFGIGTNVMKDRAEKALQRVPVEGRRGEILVSAHDVSTAVRDVGMINEPVPSTLCGSERRGWAIHKRVHGIILGTCRKAKDTTSRTFRSMLYRLPNYRARLPGNSPRINEKQREEKYPPHVNFAARAGLAALPGTSGS